MFFARKKRLIEIKNEKKCSHSQLSDRGLIKTLINLCCGYLFEDMKKGKIIIMFG